MKDQRKLLDSRTYRTMGRNKMERKIMQLGYTRWLKRLSWDKIEAMLKEAGE